MDEMRSYLTLRSVKPIFTVAVWRLKTCWRTVIYSEGLEFEFHPRVHISLQRFLGFTQFLQEKFWISTLK